MPCWQNKPCPGHENRYNARAFKAADATIQEHGDNIIRVVGREQKWHKDAATDKQLATLKKLYKGKAIPADLSKGAACKLISQFFATQGPRPVRAPWLAAKIERGKRVA
jgi:hypothetical protein